MTTRVDQLFMVRLQLETKGLFDLARRRRLPMRMLDTGYINCHLKELFGENAPMPFAVAGEAGRLLTVLGYTTCEAEIPAKPCSDVLRSICLPELYLASPGF